MHRYIATTFWTSGSFAGSLGSETRVVCPSARNLGGARSCNQILAAVKLALAAALLLVGAWTASAASQYAKGTFAWGTDSVWATASGGSYVNAWTSGNDAFLETTAGTVTVNTVTAHNINFSVDGFTIQSGTLTLNGTTPTVTTGSGSDTISSKISGSSGLTKAGVGTLTLSSSSSDYTGATTVSTGTLLVSSTTGLGASTTVLVGNGATLQLHIDSGGTIALANTALGTGTTSATIDVNNNGSGTGGVIQLNGASPNMGSSTYNITGGNGYSLYVANVNSAAGNATTAGAHTFNPTTASLTIGKIQGTKHNNTVTDTYTLGGTATGNSVTGQILDSSAGAPTIIKKSNTGTWTLSGNSTYTGGTTISGGTLKLTGGSLGNTAITATANAGAAFSVQPGSSTTINAGTSTAGSSGATLALNNNTFDMTDGATSTFNLQQQTSFSGTALTLTSGATLKFDLGGSTTAVDLLAVTGSASVAGTINVTVNTIGSTALTPATYNIITAASGLTTGSPTWQFTGGGTKQTVTVGGHHSNISLNAAAAAVSLGVVNAYAVTYNANYPAGATTGGSVPTDSNFYDSGATVSVSGNPGSLTASGYTFLGWDTSSTATSSTYPVSSPGTFVISSDTTLYAVWQSASGTITASSSTAGTVSTTYGTASSPTTFTVSASGLTGNLTVGALSGFEYSTSSGGTYSSTLTLTPSGGTLASTTVYVRLAAATVAGTYSGNITISGGGAALQNVSIGFSTVSPATLTVTGASAQSKIFDGTTVATVGGTLSGVVNGDSLTLSGTFPSSAVGNYTVTFAVSGTHASSYTLTQPGVTASIMTTLVWSSTSSGLNWSTPANWLNNVVATGLGETADFSQVDITADTTVNLDQNYTIGSLIFGNTDASPNANWTLTGNVLTTTNITVNALGTGKAAIINSAIGGSGKLYKAGSGTLSLTASNSYSGGTTLSAGTLLITTTNGLGSGGVTVPTTATLQVHIDGGGILPLLTGLANSSGANFTIDVNNNGGVGTGGMVQFNGTPGTANGTNNFTGGNGYSVYVDSINSQSGSATTPAGNITFNPTTASLTIGKIQGTKHNSTLTDTYILDGSATGNAVTGIIANSTAGAPTVIIKQNTSTWTLLGTNTYSGATTISGGTLVVGATGVIPINTVSVATNGTLGGNGLIMGAVVVAGGGSFTPGTSGAIGTLTISNTLTLAANSTNVFRVSRNSGTLSQDAVAGAMSVTAGGALNITTANGSDALQDGDTFTLFNVQPLSTFSTLPTFANGGTNWWTTDNYKTVKYNLWPTAGTATYHHNRGIRQMFTVADLLTHVTGATSGKTITLMSLAGYADLTAIQTLPSGATLQANGLLSSGSTLILYTPASTDNGDSVSYVISDGRGGTPSGTVSLVADAGTVFGQQSPQLTADGNGHITIKFYGVPGYSYYVQRADDVNFTQNVTELGPKSATTSNPIISVTDNITANGQAYYRLEWRP